MRIISADHLKREIPPAAFYACELPDWKPPRRLTGWVSPCPCPFHDETPPGGSFRVDLGSGAFLCHACGAKGGDILAFVMARDGLTLPEAIGLLADEWGVTR